MLILSQLKNLKKLTASEETLVDYILQFPEQVIHQSPKELAEKSYVSVSTIYRLINKLSLEGLNDLKLLLMNDLNKNQTHEPINIDFPISPEDNLYAMKQKLESVYKQTIHSTADITEIENWPQNNLLLQNAHHIDVYASSANVYFAQNFQFQMQEIGKHINVPVNEYMQLLSAANSTSQNLSIVVSYGGRSANIYKLLTILKQNQSKILLITSVNSPLLKEAVDGICLFPALENHYNKVSSFSTRMSLMYIFDLLYLNYFNQNYEQNLAYKLANYKKMNPTLR